MKKAGFTFGLIVIIILLLLQTRFNIFLQLDSEGYAVRSNTVRSALLADPNELMEEETIQLYAFNPLDYIYSRIGSYYMGEEKKTQIDMAFPLYINGGAGLYFTGNNGTLFDVDYEKVDVYQGLSVTDAKTYNPGGDRADGIEFTFYSTANGFFYNLKDFIYLEKGKERVVSTNSAIYFTDSYFTYCEPEGDVLNYQVARFMTDNSKVIVNGEEMPYHELLVRLGVVGADKDKVDKSKDKEENIVVPTPTPETSEQENAIDEQTSDELITDDSATDKKDKKEKSEKEKVQKERSGGASQNPPSSGANRQQKEREKGNKDGANNRENTGEKDSTAKGVRPDSLRPDKVRGETKPAVQGYIKPIVEYNSYSTGVYRIMLDMTVKDPSGRIDSSRRVQYEFYEIGEGGKETLVYRTYSASSGTISAGDGKIKPDTEYRVNIFYTYKDEYDEKITESVKSDLIVKTQPFNQKNAVITIRKGFDDKGVAYGTIPYYYDNYLEVTNFTYELPGDEDARAIAEEYLYGLNSKGGIILTIKKDGSLKGESQLIESSVINKFKKGVLQNLDSMRNLEPNSKYEYVITMKDFFGNDIRVINGEDSFETSKSRPVGKIELTRNVIGGVDFKLELTDPDQSAVKSAAQGAADDDYDLYFVLSTEDIYKVSSDRIYDQAMKYLYPELDGEGNIVNPAETVHYAFKIPKESYLNDGVLGFEDLLIENVNTIDLDTRYYGYILGDYDLNNNKGIVRHDPIASMNFRSAALTSLGSIYITTYIDGITAHGAHIIYDLNENRTNDDLTKLLSDIEFDIDTTNGEEPDTHSKIVFDESMMHLFTGYTHDANGVAQTFERDRIEYPEGSGEYLTLETVEMDADYFDTSKAGKVEGDDCQYYLESMTDYKITPKIYALYNGKKYPMKVVLTKTNFKTMREPAKVDVQNLVLAGGTLRFDVHIADPDEAITGLSGQTVIMDLYDNTTNTVVRAVRYYKNQYEDGDPTKPIYYSEEITGLDPNKRYHMVFVAVKYNEGYDSSTEVSNKIISRVDIDEITDIRGTIKLHGLDAAYNQNSKLIANLNVKITDNADIMTGSSMPYYIRITRDGVDVTSSYSGTAISDYTVDNRKIDKTSQFLVDKGNHTYKATLYIMYKSKELVLDSVSFTTTDTMKVIHTADEFYDLIKADADDTTNGSGVATGRYCVADDIDLGNCSGIPVYDEDGNITSYNSKKVPVKIATTFNGEIDFQGFTVTFDKSKNSNGWFYNIGPKAEIYNLVLEAETSCTGNIHDQGLISNRNYGNIHDIYIHYKGGKSTDTGYYGLVTRINAVGGIIENFVIHSDAVDDYYPFTAYRYSGLVCSNNLGIIRYGYVYGSDIYTAREQSTADIYVGGIAGENIRAGQIYDVYSSVNIKVDNNIEHKYYGSVVGGGSGQLRNVYNVGVPTHADGSLVDPDGSNLVGSVTGYDKKTYRDVYYWNEANTLFAKAPNQQRVSLENLNDYAWQHNVLEDHFDVQPVEVGYYPHVIWSSDEMPQQEYVPLPGRTSTRIVDLLSAEVLSYNEDGTEAEVLFRFSNTKNAYISGVKIENDNLMVTLDQESAVSQDGFTTIKGTLFNPKVFKSEYAVDLIQYNLGGSNGSTDYTVGTNTVKPSIMVDFYRLVHNPDEWYDYVICKPTENARLANDIDFSGVPMDRIRMPGTGAAYYYSGKLDGGVKILEDGTKADYGYSLKNINFTGNKGLAVIFYVVDGSITNLCIENYTNDMINKDYTGFIYQLNGAMDNVHMNNITLSGNQYVAPMACYMAVGSSLHNSSVNGLTINYVEKTNTNSTAYIGGLVGYLNQGGIKNCYATDIDITVSDVKSAEGVGGIVGRGHYAQIENVYATGSISGRCQNVGGIVGFYESNAVSCDIKNAISRVDVVCYQDAVGGLIGQLKLTENLINPRNNLSGVAYGNVTCENASAENVSHTIAYMAGSDGAMYGAEFQMINGLPNSERDEETGLLKDHSHGLISYEQATNPATYTDSVLLNMDYVYDYSGTANELLPKLYYADSTKLLPFQKDIRITELRREDDLLSVSSVAVDEVRRNIILYVKGPAGYRLTGFEIEDLGYVDPFDPESPGYDASNLNKYIIPETGELPLVIEYFPEVNQEHFKDSYLLTHIDYIADDLKTIGTSTFNDTPVVIPLTMYGMIDSLTKWNYYFRADNNYGNYENYKVTDDIDFSIANYEVNAKVGRLVGVPNVTKGQDKIVLKNVNLTGNYENLLFRVNTEISNFSFEHCDVNTDKRNGVGLIGTSSGKVKNLNFSDITVETKYSYTAMIAWQYGGSVEDITMKKISVNGKKTASLDYIGGLLGSVRYGTLIKNVNTDDVTVYGRKYVGGIVGSIVGSMEDVHGKNIKVTGYQCRIGGLAGEAISSRQTNGNAAYFNNLSIEGDFVKDKDGKESPTTVVSYDLSRIKNDSISDWYDIGGIAGYCSVYGNGFKAGFSITGTENENDAAARPISVDGIVVRGYGNYVGGAYGRCNDIAYTTVTNTRVENEEGCKPDIVFKNMGALAGRVTYYARFCTVENCEVKSYNYQECGILAGYTGYASQYNYAVDSKLYADSNMKDTLTGFGGLVGYGNSNINYSFAKDIVVEAKAPNMEGVGGITGYMNASITGCGVYCTPENSNLSPTAKSQYYLNGNRYVGGIVGRHHAGTLLNSYSNINVIGDYYVGGIDGRYENNYKDNVIDGKPKPEFPSIYLRSNYFAGTVRANKYAGGLIGSLGIKEVNNLDSGRTKSVTGDVDETTGTYRNLMVAETIDSSDEHAYAFAGNLDGFEGMANYQTLTDYDSDTRAKYARMTMFWEKTLVNGVALEDMEAPAASSGMDYTRNTAANLGGKRYAKYAGESTVSSDGTNSYINGSNAKYGQYNQDDGKDRGNWNVRLVSTDNMKCSRMYWSLNWNNVSTYAAVLPANTNYWVILAGDITSTSAPYNSEYGNGTSYLPQARIKSDTSTVNTFSGRLQVREHMNMPIPQGYVSQIMGKAMMAMFMMPVDNYGILYASDVDRINVEFGQDLVDNGYFVLKAGGKVVDRQIIHQRVYTYSYDQSVNLELCYGEVDMFSYMYDYYDYNKGEYKDGRTEDGVFDYPDLYLSEFADDTYKVASLRHHIMTYGTKYYYISDEGLVEGSGSSVIEEDDEKTRIVDSSATTTPGKYLSIYNGHALMEDGSVVDITTKQPIRTIEKEIKCLNNAFAKDYDPANAVTAALQNFSFNGTNTTVFHKYTDYDGFGNSGQFMTSANGDIVFIDKDLDNYKDAVTFYLKGDEQYCTIVDHEGYIQDLYRGGGTSSINAPENMHMSGVVYATNNLNCTAPFILVEYANGGIVGYNYMTGEYLFDESVRNVMDLTDYIKVYFEGDKPEKSYADYAANAKLAKMAITADRLSAMVLGANTGLPVDEHESNGETAFDPDSTKAEAQGLGALTGDKTALREGETGAKSEDEDDKSLDYSLSDSSITDDDKDNNSSDKKSGSEDEKTSTGDGTSTGSSDISVELERPVGITSVQGLGLSVGLDNDGTALGNGTGGTGLGTSLANGIGGASNTGLNEELDAGKSQAAGEGTGAGTEEVNGEGLGDGEEGIKAGPSGLEKPEKEKTEESEGLDDSDDKLGSDKSEVGKADKDKIEDEEFDPYELGIDEDKESEAGKDKSSKIKDADDKSEADKAEKPESDKDKPIGKDSEADDEAPIHDGKEASEADNLNIKTIEEIDMTSADPTEEPSDPAKVVETKQTLIAVYNAATGEYEILDMTKYMSDPTYKSENSRLAVRDLTVYSDYHAEQKDTKKENGLWMYILSILAVLGGIGGGVYFKKKHNMKV